MRWICGFLAILGGLSAQLPPSIPAQRPSLKLIEEGNGRKVWHSRRFEFISTASIPERPLQRLAAVADTTVQAVASHPLPLFQPPKAERLKIIILHDDASYVAEGGQLGSAGMYLGPKQCVIIHAQHLFGSRPGSRLQPMADENLVVHEVTHLCMHWASPRLPQWLNEGICEYFASAHQGAGRFSFKDIHQSIRDHLQRRFPTDYPAIPLVGIDEVTDLNSRQWARYLGDLLPEERLQPYGTALLLAHYHLHGGAQRRNQIAEALERTSPREPSPFTTLKADAPTIQRQLSTYWKTRGISLVFPVSSSAPREVKETQ